jgi:tetratricopeptide (TPR) repeat protein
MPGIFISHTHSDHLVADALNTLIETLFGRDVDVRYSTGKELEKAITPGEDWFNWIVEQVQSTDVAFILLTPASLQKPWVIWEAGAVAGAAFASGEAGEGGHRNQARVLPILFGVRSSDLPDFFARLQVVSGTSESEIIKLTDLLLKRFGKDYEFSVTRRFLASQPAAVKKYLSDVADVLLKLPHLITEPTIQEWLERIGDLEKNRRYSEAVVLEDWLDVSFGRDESDMQRPIDVRIHRRLGEMYAAAKDPIRAARQFELARQLVPRDIFILRHLGKANLDKNDLDAARTVLQRITDLDPTAFVRNVENAAFKARVCRESNDLSGARDALDKAFSNNPNSYYLGDLLGQTLVELGRREEAKDVYRRVRNVLRDVREQNVWTFATALTAGIVTDESESIDLALTGLRSMRPSRGELETIQRGVGDLVVKLGAGDAVLPRLRQMEPKT